MIQFSFLNHLWHVQYGKWHFSITGLKEHRKNVVCIPLHLALGYGNLGDRLARGGWFSFSLLNRDIKEGEPFRGINFNFLVKQL